ncbi:MAG: flagellar hook-length control protein FliK [bacterium]|nr:flagellar hook-length control protein FliK [bacterium]
MINNAVKISSEEIREPKLQARNETRGKDDTFLNLLVNKLEDKPETVRTEKNERVDAEETPENNKTSSKKEEPAQKKETKEMEMTRESLVSQVGYFIDKLKEFSLSPSKGKQVRNSGALKEKLIMEIGSFLEKVKDLNLFRISPREMSELRLHLNNILKLKDIKDKDLFRKLTLFFKGMKESILQPESQTKGLRLTVRNEAPNAPEKNKPWETDNSWLKNKKVEVVKNKPVMASKSLSRPEDSGNDHPLSRSTIQNRMFQSQVVESKLNKTLDGQTRLEDEIKARKVDMNELINRVADKIKITLNENKNEVVMNLKPEFLGKLSVKLEFKDNTVSGKFLVDNPYAEKVMKDGLAQLKVAFQNMGLEVAGFDVNMGHQFGAMARQDGTGRIDHVTSLTAGSGEEIRTEEALPDRSYDENNWIARNINITI